MESSEYILQMKNINHMSINIKLLFSTISFGLFLGLQNMPLGHAESLPKQVDRHEQEIQRLRQEIQLLKKKVEDIGSIQTSGKVEDETACKKDFKAVGRIKIPATILYDGWEDIATGIILKYNSIKISLANTIFLSSNISELNNTALIEGMRYTFSHKGCNYILDLAQVYIDSQGELTSLHFILNYK